jgi:sugar lactone lactonase YvrE
MKNKATLCVTLIAMLLLLSACGGRPASSSQVPTGVVEKTSADPGQGAPTITGFSPVWQAVGSAITISGTNFDPAAANNSVKFSNDVQATVASATSTSLVVIVPTGTINGNITVATAGGTGTSTAIFVVKASGGSTAPTITNSPTSGTIGSTVTISGTNFDAAPANNIVTFNGTPAVVSQANVPASQVMATSLLVTVPSATNGNITVTTPGGTAVSANTFTITPIAGTAPAINRFIPLRGNTGTIVTISGANFDPTAANNVVKFNGAPAIAATSATATELTVTAPTGVTTGPITVTTAGITAKSSASFTVTGGVPVAGLKGGAIQGTPLNLLGTALTFAGGGVVNSANDGSGTTARFNNPNGIASDGTSLYVADSGNRVIRRIDISTGVVTTLAGSGLAGPKDGTGTGASFSTPNGITTDGVSLFVADSGNNRVRKITPLTGALATMTSANAQVTTLAGTGSLSPTAGSPWDSPTGTSATIRSPYGITTDGTSLYVSDGSNRLRKIDIATSAVTTLAGSGAFSSTDGTGALASFYRPHGITISPDKSTLYVADSGTNVIRKVVISSGVVSTFMGPGFTFTTTFPGQFHNPNGLSISADGSKLFVVDTSKNRILQIDLTTATNNVTVLAGSGDVGSLDATGPLATFRLPNGIVLSGANLYVSDSGNNLIRKIDVSTHVVTTFAGSVVVPSDINGIGVSSKFSFPYGITTDGTNLYVADSGDWLIRKIVISSGVVTNLAGSNPLSVPFGTSDARGEAAILNYPFGITTDGTNLYVADTGNNTIRQIVIATGDVTTLAGSGAVGSTDGIGTAASFNQPVGITTDNTNLYIADTGNHKIRQIVISTGVVTTMAGSGATGSSDGTGAAASFRNPAGVTVSGNQLYIADSGNNKIRQVDITSGSVTTFAGTGTYWYNDVYDTEWSVACALLTTSAPCDGVTIPAGKTRPQPVAYFRSPAAITTDGTYLFVADSDNNEIRRIEIATGMVTTVSGSGAFGSLDGTGTEASFSQPVGITTDGTYLYTTEYLNNLIRKIQ